jgi:hypothetical protein
VTVLNREGIQDIDNDREDLQLATAGGQRVDAAKRQLQFKAGRISEFVPRVKKNRTMVAKRREMRGKALKGRKARDPQARND